MVNKIKGVRAKLRNNKGFTLIEMLVVVAIIGILVLLALPRYVGYTKDANKATMQADIRVLESAALVANIDNEKWPAGTEVTGKDAVTFTGETVYAIDETKIDKQIQSLKNAVADYGIITSGDNEGKVVHLEGVEDRDGNTHYGLGTKFVAKASGADAESEADAGDGE